MKKHLLTEKSFRQLLTEKSIEQLVDEMNNALEKADKEPEFTPEEEAEYDAEYGYFEDD